MAHNLYPRWVTGNVVGTPDRTSGISRELAESPGRWLAGLGTTEDLLSRWQYRPRTPTGNT